MISLYILAGLVALAFVFVGRKSGVSGLREGATTSVSLLRTVARMLVLGMLLAGMTQAILPAEVIRQWMGDESGFTGILLGTVVGMLIPGGPYVVIPLAAAVFLEGGGGRLRGGVPDGMEHGSAVENRDVGAAVPGRGVHHQPHAGEPPLPDHRRSGYAADLPTVGLRRNARPAARRLRVWASAVALSRCHAVASSR